MKKYHVNPNTGVPAICNAENGNCPFGEENHYPSFEAAQRASLEMMNKEYGLLPMPDKVEKTLDEYFGWFDAFEKQGVMTREQRMEVYKHKGNPDMMKALIYGTIEDSDEWKAIEAALLNENMGADMRYELVNHPENFSARAIKTFAGATHLTKEEIAVILRKAQERKDYATIERVYENPVIDGLFLRKQIEEYERVIDTVPYHALLRNPNTPKEIVEKYKPRLVGKPIPRID